MKDNDKTKEELIIELAELRLQHAELVKMSPHEVHVCDNDLKQRSQAMRDTLYGEKEFKESVFLSIQDGIAVIDTNGVFLDVNDALCRMMGLTREELIGVGLPHPYWPQEELGEIERAFQKMQALTIDNFELTFKRKNGERFPVIIFPAPMHNREGRIVGYCATIKDITERKRSEDALRKAHEGLEHKIADRTRDLLTLNNKLELEIAERKQGEEAIKNSEANLNSLINCIDESIWSVDNNYNYIIFNTFFRNAYFTAYNVKLQKGMSAIGILTPELQAFWKQKYDSALLGQRVIFEFSAQIKSELKFYEVFLNPIKIDEKISGVSALSLDITERKRAEEALTHSHDLMRYIIEHSRSAIAVHDRDLKYVYVSRRYLDEYKVKERDIIGKHHYDVFPDLPQKWRDVHQKVLAGEVLSAEDDLYERADGSVDWTRWECRPWYQSDGTIGGIIVYTEIITEHKRAEQTLRETKELLSLFIQHSPIYAFIKEVTPTESRVLQASENFYDLIGISSLEMMGKTMQELFQPDFARQITADDWAVVSGGNVLKREEKLHGYTYTTIKFPFVQKDKTLLGGYTIDITQQKEAEEKLRQSEQFIRNILDTVDEGFIVIDRDFRILTINKSYCSQVGSSCVDVIGRHCYEVSHKAVKPCYEEGEECPVRHVFETGEPYASLHKHKDAKGAVIHVETKAFPIKDSSGAVVSAIETVNNITERYLLEEERLKAQKLDAIGTLAGGIAHDFNNLLQGIFGYISMAKLTLDQKEKALQMLEEAEKALRMSVNLTSQLLTFSKGGKPVREMISLQPVIENSTKFALSGSRADYRITLDEDLWTVEADEGQIGQVIQNIVLNADQAMPLGGTIKIIAKNVLAHNKELPQLLGEGKYVVISVKDSGIGISEQFLQKVFDPYYTTKEKGSGLGLATSYSIVRNHGGVIKVNSKVGKGTTFYVYLPALEVRKETSQVSAVPPVDRKGKILLMDDDELIRNIAGEQLKVLEHEVECAERGEEAIEKYQSARESDKPFDIVILDLTIRGGMGGKETIERLLVIDPDIRAIVSSGYSGDAVVANYEKYGFKARLTKPYKLKDLRDTLNALLSA